MGAERFHCSQRPPERARSLNAKHTRLRKRGPKNERGASRGKSVESVNLFKNQKRERQAEGIIGMGVDPSAGGW